MLKNNGKSKPTKKVKCKNCGNRVSINTNEIEEVGGAKIAICPVCYQDIELKK